MAEVRAARRYLVRLVEPLTPRARAVALYPRASWDQPISDEGLENLMLSVLRIRIERQLERLGARPIDSLWEFLERQRVSDAVRVIGAAVADVEASIRRVQSASSSSRSCLGSSLALVAILIAMFAMVHG